MNYRIAALLVFMPAAAFANVGKISGPVLEEGATRAKYLFQRSENGDAQQRAEFDYAIDHDWVAEIGIKYDQPHDEDSSIQEATAELMRTFTRQSEGWWLSSALLGEFALNTTGDPNAVSSQLRMQRDQEHFRLRFNSMLEREWGGGDTDDIELGSRALAMWKLHPNINPAMEWHAEWGTLSHPDATDRQRHWAGPALYGELFKLPDDRKIDYQIAYLFGVTNPAINNVLRIAFEYKWKF